MYPAAFIYILYPSFFSALETIRQAFREIVPSDSCNRKMTLDEEKKREEIAYMYSVSVIMQTSVVQSQASQVYIYIYILSPFVDNENPFTFLNVASLFARVALQSTVLIGVVLLDFCVI